MGNDSVRRSRLKPWHAVVAFLVIGVAGQIAAVIAAVIAVAVDTAVQKTALTPASQPELPSWGMALAVLLSALVLVLGSMASARLARVPLRDALGLRSPPPVVYLLACVAAVAASPVGGLLVGFAKAVAPGFTLGSLDTMSKQVAAIPVWAAIPVFAVLPGISEETFFRGLLQRAISRPWLAVSLSAVLFAAYHVDPHHAAGTLPIGFLLAWIAWRTDSVLVSIAGHASFNLFAIILQHTIEIPDEDPGINAAAVGVAAAGAVIALGCAWAIGRSLPPRLAPRASVT